MKKYLVHEEYKSVYNSSCYPTTIYGIFSTLEKAEEIQKKNDGSEILEIIENEEISVTFE